MLKKKDQMRAKARIIGVNPPRRLFLVLRSVQTSVMFLFGAPHHFAPSQINALSLFSFSLPSMVPPPPHPHPQPPSRFRCRVRCGVQGVEVAADSKYTARKRRRAF